MISHQHTTTTTTSLASRLRLHLLTTTSSLQPLLIPALNLIDRALPLLPARRRLAVLHVDDALALDALDALPPRNIIIFRRDEESEQHRGVHLADLQPPDAARVACCDVRWGVGGVHVGGRGDDGGLRVGDGGFGGSGGGEGGVGFGGWVVFGG